MTYNEAAAGFFYEGYNCAQATALAFSDVPGIRKEELLRITAGFGAGMGGLRQQCGAVSAMVCIAGIVKGGYPPNDNAAKKELYDTVKAMNAAFIERFGTTECRELLAQASVRKDSRLL